MSIIEDGKITAKWSDDRDRRERVQMWIDFYHNDHSQYVSSLIDKIYTGETEKSEMRKHIEYINLTESVINEISLIFEEPCSIEIDGTEAQSRFFREMLDGMNILPALIEINKMTNLCYDWGVMPIWSANKVKLMFISPADCFVIQDPYDPTEIEGLFYRINSFANTPFTAETASRYVYWDVEAQYVSDIDMFSGAVYKNSVTYKQKNIFGEIPVVFFSNYIKQKSFWWEGGNYIVDKNLWIDVKLTSFNLGEDSSVPTLITRGYPEDEDRQQLKGWTSWINLETGEGTDAEYLSYEINKSLWDYIKERIDQVFNAYYIYPDKIRQSNSGYQIKLVKQGIIKENIKQRVFYTPKIKKLIKLCIALWNANNPAKRIPENSKISINYGEVKFEITPIERNRNFMERRQLGLESRIDQIMIDDPDLTRDEAIKRANRIDSENNTYSNIPDLKEELKAAII